MPDLNTTIRYAVIALLAAIVSVSVIRYAPGLEIYAGDLMMRERGTLPAPDDIVIIAIDEASIQRFGRYPWPRNLTAQVIKNLGGANPKAIALDILFVDPSDKENDDTLVNAVKDTRKVVLATQLSDSTNNGKAFWLSPLPALEEAAAGTGHVIVHTGYDGIARSLMIKQTDSDGNEVPAIAAEIIRIGSGFFPDSPSELFIDFIGPKGSFASRTLSFKDVYDWNFNPASIHDKYVLIGATASGIGGEVASPLIHSVVNGRVRSEFMPGVEVLANEINTILRKRFYTDITLWLAFLCALASAIAAVILAAIGRGKYELPRQIATSLCLYLSIILVAYVFFTIKLIRLPVVSMLIAAACSTSMMMLRRSVLLSKEIDSCIDQLLAANYAPVVSPSDVVKNRALRLKAGLRAIRWARGSESRSKELKAINSEMLHRALFINGAFNSIDDALLIADANGIVSFANPRAKGILGIPDHKLYVSDLFEIIRRVCTRVNGTNPSVISKLLSEDEPINQLRSLFEEHHIIEREIIINTTASTSQNSFSHGLNGSRTNNLKHYQLRITSVWDSPDDSLVGIVATLTDITRHKDLQRTQKDVIALVTHELKTPITAIRGMSEVLAQFDVDHERRQQMHSVINDEAKRLTRMIDEYLDLTRLESGIQNARMVPIRIELLISKVLLLFDPIAEKRNIKIVRIIADDLLPSLGDPDLITRAITNLIDNAIKFSPDLSTITVSAFIYGNSVAISVEDQGCGIPKEFIGNIFEKFYRVPRAEHADIPGTGLGLVFVKETAEIHNGSVTVDSKPGKGTTFTLYL